jgi:hypothetical protein
MVQLRDGEEISPISSCAERGEKARASRRTGTRNLHIPQKYL